MDALSIISTILIILAILAIIYVLLIAPRMFRKPDRTPFYGFSYAHRGLFNNDSEAPENSLAAFRAAVDNGYGIELDVQLSKDDIPVVFHDASLKRMCGVDGKVWEYTLEELQQFKLANSSATIPTFADVLALVNGKVPLIIEYKLDVAQTKVCQLANELLSKYNGPYCIECFHPLAVLWYRKHRPDILRGQLSMDFRKDEQFKNKPLYAPLSYMFTNILTRPDFIAYRHSDASNLSRRICRALGALSVAWTIQNEEEQKAASKTFDLFIFESFVPQK